jgi:short-subunit dehydrogenase
LDVGSLRNGPSSLQTISIGGSTDRIGLETATMMISQSHHVLLHGWNPARLEKVERMLPGLPDGGPIESSLIDLPRKAEAMAPAKPVAERHTDFVVLINSTCDFCTSESTTSDGLDGGVR